jgi:hypothetical protein
MSTSDPRLDATRLHQRREKRIAVFVILLLALVGSAVMFAHPRPISTPHSFRSISVDDRAPRALQIPEVQLPSFSLYVVIGNRFP